MSAHIQSHGMEEQQQDVMVESGEGSNLLVNNGAEANNGRRTKFMWAMLLVVSCVAALSASAHVSGWSRSDAAKKVAAPDENRHSAAPMQVASKKKVTKCNLAFCTDSGCAWDSAPYLCTDGESTGGCAAHASTWAPEKGGCNAFCDLSDCADILKKAEAGGEGAEDLPRRCGKCDDKQCAMIAKQWSQACGSAAPFMCLSGSATWGCADTELAWASAPATTCGECCDVKGCAGDR